MRDLLYKNLTSSDGKRRILVSSEIIDNEGVRSIIRRQFVCLVKEIKGNKMQERPLPYLYLLKERNTLKQKEKFYCRIKGSVYAVSGGRLFLILYMHSLKINLATLQMQS